MHWLLDIHILITIQSYKVCWRVWKSYNIISAEEQQWFNTILLLFNFLLKFFSYILIIFLSSPNSSHFLPTSLPTQHHALSLLLLKYKQKTSKKKQENFSLKFSVRISLPIFYPSYFISLYLLSIIYMSVCLPIIYHLSV